MNLENSIKQIVAQFGKDKLKSNSVFGLLEDFQAFEDEKPAAKNIVKQLCNMNYIGKFAEFSDEVDSWSLEVFDIIYKVSEQHGLQKDLVSDTLHKIALGIGIVDESFDWNDEFLPSQDVLSQDSGAVNVTGNGQPQPNQQQPIGTSQSNVSQPSSSYLMPKEKAGFFSRLFNRNSSESKFKIKKYIDDFNGCLLEKLDPLDLTSEFGSILIVADNGNADAQFVVGRMYYEGKGTQIDYQSAVHYFELAASQGQLYAICNLGICYKYGRGVKENLKESVGYFYNAANQGLVWAMRKVADVYYEGKGIEQSYTNAAAWYKKAVKAGDYDAMYDLGYMYYYGQGVEQNALKALTLINTSANHGNVNAMYLYGVANEEGKFVAKDYDEASKYYKKAAQKGHIRAQYRLGWLLYQNEDYVEAVTWLKKSAEQGDSDAQYVLGTCYLLVGIPGLPSDHSTAYYWLSKSAAQGNKNAEEYIFRFRGLFNK